MQDQLIAAIKGVTALPRAEAAKQIANDGEFARALASARGRPDAAQLSHGMFGAAMRSTSPAVEMAFFAEQTSEEIADLSKRITSWLKQKGIETEGDKADKIEFGVDDKGALKVAETNPAAGKIEKLLSGNEEMSFELKRLIRAADTVAVAEVASRYTRAWHDAEGAEGRDQVFDQYRAMFDRLKRDSGGMTLDAGTLTPSSTLAVTGLFGTRSG